MTTKPKVSVCMITYNHEKYIRKAIEGVLMQVCDFEVELIVANDCSTDATDIIIEDILKNHPRASWIKYINHKENAGMMPNFIWALNQCNGKYIALCEGDDYWTDPLKLQKQVRFLNNNQEYVLSFHNAEVIYSTNNKNHLFIKEYKKQDYTADDILSLWLIPTASMVFRNVFKGDFPLFLSEATHGDLALQVYLYEFGKFNVMNEAMSVYRINESSVTVNSFSSLSHNKLHIEQLKLMNNFFNGKYNCQIQKRIFIYYLRNANTYRSKSLIKPIYWLFKAVLLNPKLIVNYHKQYINSIKIMFYTFRIFLKLKK